MNELCDNPKSGTGLFYLWHLQAIGLIGADHEPVTEWGVDNTAGHRRRARVAIIDNGCASGHPNLSSEGGEQRIADVMEYAAYPHGLVYRDVAGRNPYAGLATKLKERLGVDLSELLRHHAVGRELRDLLKRIADGDPPMPECLPDLPDPAERFAAHGTACAGLVAADARPRRHPDQGDDDLCGDADKHRRAPNPNAIPYSGVDPDAIVIPITTVYSPDYWPLIMALLYAVAADADVILLPRAVEDMAPPGEPCAEGDPPGRAPRSRLDTDRHRHAEKLVFERLLAEISAHRPVIVPAGNTGLSQLEYPARLVHGVAPELIVVGAATARGLPASYSSHSARRGEQDDGVTVHAPSDDREEVSQAYFRFDPMLWRGRQLHLGQSDTANTYSPYGILAIDVPRQYGYAAEPGDLRDYEEAGVPADVRLKRERRLEHRPRAIYTLFGGTSAAASIVAGVVSRMQHVAPSLLSGAAVKQILRATAKEAPDMEAGTLGMASVAPVAPDGGAARDDAPASTPESMRRGCTRVSTMIDAARAIEAARATEAPSGIEIPSGIETTSAIEGERGAMNEVSGRSGAVLLTQDEIHARISRGEPGYAEGWVKTTFVSYAANGGGYYYGGEGGIGNNPDPGDLYQGLIGAVATRSTNHGRESRASPATFERERVQRYVKDLRRYDSGNFADFHALAQAIEDFFLVEDAPGANILR